jgi:hypothetical protein
MSFQYEHILLPDKPVLLVNRDWQIPGRKPRKSEERRESSLRGQIYSFGVKGQSEGTGNIHIEASSSRSGKNLSGVPAVDGESSRSQQRSRVRQNLGATQIAGQSPSPDSSPANGEGLQARMHDSAQYNITPNSGCDATGRGALPGVDAPLLKLISYDAPKFIPKANYLSYCSSNAILAASLSDTNDCDL